MENLKDLASKLEKISKDKTQEKEKAAPLVLSKVGIDNIEIKNLIDDANSGDLNALTDLGIYYLTGVNVEQDYTLARQIFEKGAAEKQANAFYGLGLIYEYGYNVESNFKEALFYYEEGAKLGSLQCLYKQGIFYLNAFGTKQNFKKAFECFKKGALSNDANCTFALGGMYENGAGVEQNDKMALNYYRKASELGNDDACCYMANKYIEGVDIEKNVAKAIELLQGPIENEDDDAYYILGTIYLTDESVQNIDMGIRYLKKASELKNNLATHLLAIIYRDGAGPIEPNMLISRKYYKLASEQGNINAKVELTYFKRNDDGEWYFDLDSYQKNADKIIDQYQKEIDEEEGEDSDASSEEDEKTSEEPKEEATTESGYRDLYNAETLSLDDIHVAPEFDELIKPTDINDKKPDDQN